jgi:hypothetical protein
MALATYFSGLQVSGDGTNFSRVFANAADSDNLTLSSFTDTIVSTAANIMYVNSAAVSTSLNTTLDALKVLADAAATSIELAAEEQAREDADTALQTNIDTEASSRASAVTTLESADDTLQSNIDALTTSTNSDFVLDRARLDAIEALLGNLQSA